LRGVLPTVLAAPTDAPVMRPKVVGLLRLMLDGLAAWKWFRTLVNAKLSDAL